MRLIPNRQPFVHRQLLVRKIWFYKLPFIESQVLPSFKLGNPYAAQYGAEWHRILIDKSYGNVEVFYVDIGHRQRIQPTMMLHNLPERY